MTERSTRIRWNEEERSTILASQPVEQTLRRHGKRYMRNARGVAGLRSELGGLALSGDGAGGG